MMKEHLLHYRRTDVLESIRIILYHTQASPHNPACTEEKPEVCKSLHQIKRLHIYIERERERERERESFGCPKIIKRIAVRLNYSCGSVRKIQPRMREEVLHSIPQAFAGSQHDSGHDMILSTALYELQGRTCDME